MVFDGENRLILLEDNETELDVKEMYIKWREWANNVRNLKYPLAMRYVGGDKLPKTRLGITYFLINGWKIKPASKNYTLTINGNLYGENGENIFVPADGNVNVLIINKVSNIIDIVYSNGYNNVVPNPTPTVQPTNVTCEAEQEDWVLTQ